MIIPSGRIIQLSSSSVTSLSLADDRSIIKCPAPTELSLDVFRSESVGSKNTQSSENKALTYYILLKY